MAKPKSKTHGLNDGDKMSHVEFLDRHGGEKAHDIAPTLLPVFTGRISPDGSPEVELRSYASIVGNIDVAGLGALNTVFGDRITAKRVPNITAHFFYGIQQRSIVSQTAQNGAVTIEGNSGYENILKASTGSLAGGEALIESVDGVRYIAGYEYGLYATAMFKPPTGDGYIKAGLFDGENGYWWGYKEIDGVQHFGVCREKDGVEYFVKQSDFNKDTIDGNGNSGFVFDESKGNIFLIKSGYLGFAGTSFLIFGEDNRMIEVHRIEYPNMYDETNVSNSNLPVRIEVSNGTTGEEVWVKTGSVSGYLADGANLESNVRQFYLPLEEQIIATNVGNTHVNNPIMAFRNTGLFQGTLMDSVKAHRIFAQLQTLSLTLNGQNKGGVVELHLFNEDDVTLSVGTWRDVDTDSVIDYAINADGITANFTNSIAVTFSDTFRATAEKLIPDLSKRISGLRPKQVAILVINSTTALPIETNMSASWNELF
jgi:hypothetical protein